MASRGALTSVASSASPVCSPYSHEETVGKPRAQRAEEFVLQLWFEFELWLFGDRRQRGRSERSERRSLCCSCGLSLSWG